MDITVILDNGGGVTLQVWQDDEHKYQHTYMQYDGQQCAEDIAAIVIDNYLPWDGWDGNDLEPVSDGDDTDYWMEVSSGDVRNGGARELSAYVEQAGVWPQKLGDFDTLMDAPEEEAWGHNGCNLRAGLRKFFRAER